MDLVSWLYEYRGVKGDEINNFVQACQVVKLSACAQFVSISFAHVVAFILIGLQCTFCIL